jgi:hypothetical protein
MCTGSQNIVESYYILKEILKFQNPKIVIYDIYLPSLSKWPDYYQVLSNAKFMSKSGRLDLIINGFKVEGLINWLLPILKYKEYLTQDISNIFKSKETYIHNSYWIKGYLYDDKVVDSITVNNFQPIQSFKNTTVSIDFIEYHLTLLLKLCTDNNVKLICVRAPFPPARLKISPPDTVYTYFKQFNLKHNIPFYDFNYLKGVEYYNSDFGDDHHMNKNGANKISKELGKILNEGRIHNIVYLP